MGGVADAVSGVLGTDGGGGGLLGIGGDIIESVGDIAQDVVREVGSAVESVGREAGKIGQAAINDPVGTIAKVAAVATQQYWALPLISAATVVASGGDLMQAALAAGISYAGMEIASGLTDYLAGPAFDSVASMAAQDAVALSAQGLSAGQIAEVLGQSYQLGSNVAGSMAAAAAAGIPASTVATAYAGAFGEQLNGVMTTASQKILQGAAGNGVANAAMTIARGGDPTEALISSLTGAAGTVVGGNANIGLRELGANAAISNVLSATAGAATKGLLSGQDFTTATGSALINNIINTTLSESGKAIKNSEFAQGVKNQFNSLIEGAKGVLDSSSETAKAENAKLLELSRENEGIMAEAKSIQSEAEDYKTNTLTPAQQAAEKAYEVAMGSYNEYKSVTDKFGELVTKYDEAKAAGNISLANQLADEANALIPDINTKTAAYNSDFNEYDAAKNDFATKNETFTGYANKLTELNTKYLEVNNRTNEQAKVVESAATTFEEARSQFENSVKQVIADTETAQNTVADYSTDAQKAFERAFASGKNALDAADFAGELNSQSGTAQKAFNQAFDQGLDVQDAFALSQQINALPKTAQNYYEFATSFGLKPTDAAGIVADVSGMSNIAQQVFFDNLAQKYDTEAALSAAQDVNSLNTAQQSTYFNAKLNGLDPELAMNAAREVGGLSRDQQNTYINNLRNGVDPQTAKFLAALQLDKTAAIDPNQANLGSLKTQDAKDAYNLYIAAGQDMATAKAIAQGIDDAAAAQGTGSQVAGTGSAAPFVPFNQLSQVYPPRGSETELGESGDTGQIGVSGQKPVGVLTQAEIDQYRKEGISEEDIQKAIGQYGMAPDITDQNPVIQDLINSLFTGSKPAKTAAAPTPSIPTTPGTSTTPGATTTPGTTPSTGTNTTGTATDTTGVPGTAPTTGGGSTTGKAPSGGTGTGSATTGGATSGTGTGAGGTGTAGTGTTGTGTGGGGTGGGSAGGVGGVGGGMGGGYSSWSAMYGGQDQYGGIKNLTPGLTQRSDYTLSGLPTDSDQDTVNPMMNIDKFATGGTTTDPYGATDLGGISSGIKSSLAPGLTKAQINYILTGLPGKAEGGSIEGHNPEFYSEGGLSSMENRYVEGEGDGTSDSVPAMLANGEFVIPADVVSKIGNGSNEAGAGVLDQFLVEIRKHAHSNGEKLPPESKGPLGYLLDAKRKVKA
jgi:hypothetical protein